MKDTKKAPTVFLLMQGHRKEVLRAEFRSDISDITHRAKSRPFRREVLNL